MKMLNIQYETENSLETLKVPALNDDFDIWTCISDYDEKHGTNFYDMLNPQDIIDIKVIEE